MRGKLASLAPGGGGGVFFERDVSCDKVCRPKKSVRPNTYMIRYCDSHTCLLSQVPYHLHVILKSQIPYHYT